MSQKITTKWITQILAWPVQIQRWLCFVQIAISKVTVSRHLWTSNQMTNIQIQGGELWGLRLPSHWTDSSSHPHIPFFISCQSLFWDGNTPHCSKRNASTMDKTIRQGVRMPKATWLFCFGKPAALFWCVPSVLVSALRQANTGYSHDNEINSLQSRDYEEDGERLVSLMASCIPSCVSLFLTVILWSISASLELYLTVREERKPTAKESGTHGVLQGSAGLNPLNWIKK